MFDGIFLKEKILECGYTISNLSEVLGINHVTLYRKLNGETEFTRNEICELIKALDLDDSDVKKIFFGGI